MHLLSTCHVLNLMKRAFCAALHLVLTCDLGIITHFYRSKEGMFPTKASLLWCTHPGLGLHPDSLAMASTWESVPSCFLPFLIASPTTHSPISFHASRMRPDTQHIFPAVISATLDNNLIPSSPLVHIWAEASFPLEHSSSGPASDTCI